MRFSQQDHSSIQSLPPEIEVLKHISVVVLSLNRLQDLELTIQTLRSPGDCWKEIIVCDNGSTDGTQAWLRNNHPSIKLIETSDNQGISGLNKGYAAAQGEWILTLDDDSAPRLETWDGLARIILSGVEADSISLSVVRNTRVQMRVTKSSSLCEAGTFHHAGSLSRTETVQRIGGLDPELFFWGAELHWSARAIAHGCNLLHCPDAQVAHLSSQTNRIDQRHAFYHCRNLLLLALRFAPEESWKHLVKQRVRDILVYTILQRTTLYLRAMNEAKKLWHAHPEKVFRLKEKQFAQLSIDWMAPFSFLD